MCRHSNLLWAGPLLWVLTGCASIALIIVDFDIDATVQVMRQADSAVSTNALPMRKAVIDKRRTSPFADLLYENELLSLKFTLTTDNNSATVINKAPYPVTIRLDQARFSSNSQPNEIPLWFRTNTPGKNSKVSWHLAKAFVLPAHGKGGIPMYYTQDLFPSGKLFNVQFLDHKTELIETGIGNTLRMSLPIEYEGRREIWVFQFKATDAKARTSYR